MNVRSLVNVALLALAAGPACQQDFVLEGSLTEAFDLGYATIEIKRNPRAFQVSYLKSAGREVVVRLTVVTDGIELVAGKTVDLGGEYEEGHPRTSVVRAVDGEPLRQLPPVAKGTLDIEADPSPGQYTSGSFGVVFGEGGDVGTGRTLSGTFKGLVLQAP